MAPPLLISVLIGLAVISLALKLTSRGPFSLDHKVIIITGGGCGIGRALAEKIWRSAVDITLVLLDINDASLAEVKTHLEEIQLQLPRAKSSKVLVYRCDVSDEPSVAQCISSVCEAVAPRRIGVLVNNAGIVNGKAIGDLTPQQLQRVFGVNVFAHFHLVRHVLPSMKKADHDTLIVSVASMFGYMYGCKLADYCASKAAVVSFHNCLRLELENDVLTRHIRTLLVCPLGVDTGMFTGIFDGDHGLFHLQQILAPVLTPSQVVASLYDGMVSGKVQLTSCHPGVLGAILNWLTPLTKLLPVPVQDYLAYAGGAVHGMDTFQGRQFNPQVAPTT